ncbi:MAG: LuxR C-terminal-related transcriptional regulator [Acidimicrobiia bacterium]
MRTDGAPTALAERAVPPVATAVVLGGDARREAYLRATLESAGVAISRRDPLAATGESAHVLAIVVGPNEEVWRDVEQLGVPSFVVFDDTPEEAAVADALRRGAIGALSAAGVALLASTIRNHDSPPAPTLTPRERDVLHAIDHGMSIKQTASALGISPRTVDNVQRFLFRKLGVGNRKHAVARGHSLGLLDRPEGGG